MAAGGRRRVGCSRSLTSRPSRPVEAAVPCAVRTALRRADIQCRCPHLTPCVADDDHSCRDSGDRRGPRRAACAGSVADTRCRWTACALPAEQPTTTPEPSVASLSPRAAVLRMCSPLLTDDGRLKPQQCGRRICLRPCQIGHFCCQRRCNRSRWSQARPLTSLSLRLVSAPTTKGSA